MGRVDFGIGFGVRICSFALMQKNQKIKIVFILFS